MALFDLNLEMLRDYRPVIDEPADFDGFWASTLAQARLRPTPAMFDPVANGLALVRTDHVTFAGFEGQPVHAWLHLPAGGTEHPLPCVVQFVGYGGGRGLAHENILWAVAGYAHLVVDTRGQGAGWSVGQTPDQVGSAPAQAGFMTRGILEPEDYYYRRVFVDAVCAVDAVRSHPAVDKTRVVVSGESQGGGIALAVGALVDDLAGVMPDVPFLCHFRRATEITDADPYAEISRYLKVHRDKLSAVFETLSYFDGVSFAARAKAPALFSIALMDTTCPPSTTFAAYNAYAATKELREYFYNGHEGGQGFHRVAQLRWLAELVGDPAMNRIKGAEPGRMIKSEQGDVKAYLRRPVETGMASEEEARG